MSPTKCGWTRVSASLQPCMGLTTLRSTPIHLELSKFKLLIHMDMLPFVDVETISRCSHRKIHFA